MRTNLIGVGAKTLLAGGRLRFIAGKLPMGGGFAFNAFMQVLAAFPFNTFSGCIKGKAEAWP